MRVCRCAWPSMVRRSSSDSTSLTVSSKKQAEHIELSRQLLAAGGGGGGNEGGVVQAAVDGAASSLMPEEEELLMMENSPQDTVMYRMRKKHLQEVGCEALAFAPLDSIQRPIPPPHTTSLRLCALETRRWMHNGLPQHQWRGRACARASMMTMRCCPYSV